VPAPENASPNPWCRGAAGIPAWLIATASTARVLPRRTLADAVCGAVVGPKLLKFSNHVKKKLNKGAEPAGWRARATEGAVQGDIAP